MRKLFKNHYIYTFAVGLAVFAWAFGQPPMPMPVPVEQAQRDNVVRQAAPRQDRQPQPVEPVTVIAKQVESAPSPQPAVRPEPGDITATLTSLPAAGSDEMLGQVLRVAADTLRMRAAPSPQAATLGAYPMGTQVEILARSGSWIEVRSLSDGSVGWMFADYLAAAE